MDIDKKFEGAKAILNAYIESHKMRHTPEREIVLKVVLNTTGHHTADEKCKVTVRRFDCQLTLCFDSYVLSYIHTCAAGAFKRKCLRGSDFQTFELVIDDIAFS